MRMIRRLSLAALLVLVAACGPTAKRPEPGPQPSASRVEAQVVELTNRFRHEQGLPPLAVSAPLAAVAHRHAANMARRNRYGDSGDNGHVMDGKTYEDRAREGGYVFAALAENVGTLWGKEIPAEEMVEKWKHSPGHRANMVSDRVTEIGVGAVPSAEGHWYLVQVFGGPKVPH